MDPARASREAASALSDEEVVARVRSGEFALYELLMRRSNQRLYRAVRAVLRDEEEIEDILQDTHLTAYRSLAGFEGRARFSSWLVRIAVNKAIDRRRVRSRLVQLNPALEDTLMDEEGASAWGAPKDDPEQQNARLELGLLLERAIDSLPLLLRGVYVLREVDAMSTEDTAESLGLEPGTVKTRLHRARSFLRERLMRDFDAAAPGAFRFGAERCDRLVAAVLGRIGAE